MKELVILGKTHTQVHGHNDTTQGFAFATYDGYAERMPPIFADIDAAKDFATEHKMAWSSDLRYLQIPTQVELFTKEDVVRIVAKFANSCTIKMEEMSLKDIEKELTDFNWIDFDA
jgi:hypothetical protein